MPTFGQMIDECISMLLGYTQDWPGMGTLLQDVSPTDTMLQVDFGDTPGASRPNGVIEIDNELLLVSQYNVTTNILTVPSWGRGQRGTVAAAHPHGSRVTVRPRYPRQAVARTINEAISGLSPQLHGVVDATINISAIPNLSYPLPANTFKVLRIESVFNTEWPVSRLIRDFHVNTAAGGPFLELAHRLVSPYLNQTLTVTCATEPQPMVNESDDWAATTGLPTSAYDVVVLFACARLIATAEAARDQVGTVEASSRMDKIQPGSATNVAKLWLALAKDREQSEIMSLQSRYPLVLRREY